MDPVHPPRRQRLEVLEAQSGIQVVTADEVMAAVEGLDAESLALPGRIAWAHAAIERYFGASSPSGAQLASQIYRETVAGGGGQVLTLARWPVEEAGFTVEVENQPVALEALHVDLDGGQLRRVAGWRSGAVVTYRAGWRFRPVLDGGVDMPDAVRQAAIALVRFNLDDPKVQSRDAEGMDYRAPDAAAPLIPPEVEQLLEGLVPEPRRRAVEGSR